MDINWERKNFTSGDEVQCLLPSVLCILLEKIKSTFGIFDLKIVKKRMNASDPALLPGLSLRLYLAGIGVIYKRTAQENNGKQKQRDVCKATVAIYIAL